MLGSCSSPSSLTQLPTPFLPHHQAQLAEIRHVEQQLGVRFWKIKVDSDKKLRFLKSVVESTMGPPDVKMPRRYSDDGIFYPNVPTTPFFYNM